MTTESQDLIHALDPVAWALEVLDIIPDDWQASVLRSSHRRLILNCSRQSGKSTTAAILATHRAIFYPGSLILLISPSLRQSGEQFRICADFLGRNVTSPKKIEDNRLSCTLQNGSRIVSLPSTEATIRGYSNVSLVIEDESARVPDELYYAIRPMLAVSGGRLILMSTPFGKRGHFHKEWVEGGLDWYRFEVPATECPRISPAFLEQEKRSIGEWYFAQEYLCKFKQTTDSVFRYDDVLGAISDKIAPLFTPVITSGQGISSEIKTLFNKGETV
ncbi:MAG: terminase family protein [Methanoregula sp.]|nr:terminase family protein [Methanoregula sp.]